MNVVDLTMDLIKIPSPSGEEKEIGEFLVKRLEKSFNVKKQVVGNRFNILATKGNPRLILTTHIDTVPKQIEIKEDDEWIYGRGACDTKGIIASMISASEEAVRLGYSNFGLLFDVSEESDFLGIKKAVNLVNPELVIVGEPTEFKIVKGQKGLLGLRIKCIGKSAPGSTPEKGISAINELINMLFAIKGLELPFDKELGKTTINIGKINGGTAPNVVADYAEAIMEIRTTRLNEEIINLINKNIPKDSIDILYSFEYVLTDNILLNKFGFEKIIVPYFTEMYFWSKKTKSFVFGPGQYEFAHTDNEKIKKKDLEKGKKIYLEFIKTFNKD